jgi:putative aldouronate transport system substrate-binding protein
MKKKVLATLLAATMTLSLAACGGGDSSSSGTESGGSASYDQVTYAYCTFNNIPSEADLDEVEEAINVITREKIGAEITLKPISIAEYSSKVSLALQGGEKIDIFESLGDFGNCIATDKCLDLTDLYAEYGTDIAATIPEAFIDACRHDGVLYGIPTYKPYALTPMLIYRQDIADELGIDMSTVNSLDDVTAVLEQVAAAYPDMTALSPVQAGSLGTELTMEAVDYLNDDYYNPVGVLIGDNYNVVDLYSSDEFYQICSFARNLYNNGLVMKDAATTTSMAAETMSSGNYFAYLASYSYPEEDTAASLEAQCGGYDLGAKIIGDAYLSTTDINALSWMISSTTDVPEAAMKFLNLTFTDEDIINLLIYGVEGRDYVLDDDGFVSYPEGEDSTTVPYTAQLSCGTLGNFFLMYPMVGTDKASLEWELEQNESAATSPAMGFTFDASALNTQYTAVSNVISQYLPGLVCGSLDPDTEIEKFVSALNDAGYQDILNAKQEQLDAWVAAQQ